MVKVIQIAGTWRESEKTKRFWSKKRTTKQEAERIWSQKLWLKDSPELFQKGEVKC